MIRRKFPSLSKPALSTSKRSNFLSSTLELMRDQAVFEVPSPDARQREPLPMDAGQRERQWEQETLQLFRRRTMLITTASMLSLPFFWMIFSSFAPAMRWKIGAAHLLMFLSCLTLNVAARHTNRLLRIRLISAGAYFVYGITASVVMGLADEMRVTIFSGHQHILLSMMFVPFAWPEAILCALAVAGTYAFSLSLTLPDALQFTLAGHVFSMFFLATLIVVLNELQNQARRRAFDVSFDVALSASRGAMLSNLDEVTGGHNRRHLMNMLELEMARQKRFDQPLGVIMFDLDNFKRVNDTNGHIAGDQVLRQVFAATSEILREIDTLARYGGDEFVIVLPGADAESVGQTANRVREHVIESLFKHFSHNSLESQVTLSLGAVSVDSDDDSSIEEVIARADNRLYQAKRAGKDRVCAGLEHEMS